MLLNGNFSIIVETPDTLPKSRTSIGEFRPRRNHTKSRNGCFPCKRRRIKCDEARPECSYCWEKGTPCQYSPSSPLKKRVSSPPPSPALSVQNGGLTILMRQRAWALLEQEFIPCPQLRNPLYNRADAVALLDHFAAPSTQGWIASPLCERIMREHAIPMAFNSPYLLHAVLAFSAAHMHFLHPRCRKYGIAATLHYDRALELYHNHFNSELKESDADGMMACSILLSVLAFVHTTSAAVEEPLQSANAPQWIRSMQGTEILMQAPVLRPGLDNGIWANLVRAAQGWRSNIFGSYVDLSPRSSEDLLQIQALADLCSQASPERQELYRVPLHMLRYLAQLTPCIEVGNRFVYFISMLPGGFEGLLMIEDPLALLIIAFWCSLLGRLDQWWIVHSARIECRRICECIRRLDERRFDGMTAYLATLYPATVA